MSKSKRQRKQKLLNWTNQNIWLYKILTLASTAVKWEGLPDYIDTVLLENMINRGSSAIIGYDDVLNEYIVAQNASYGRIDHNGYPIYRRGVCINGLNVNFDRDDNVIIFNNSMRTNNFWMYQFMADYMSELDVAIRVNCNTQKTMPIIPMKQEQALTGENIMAAIEDNMPYLLVDGNSLDVEKLEAALLFDNRKSFTADQILYVQNEVWNRVLTILGIGNINHFKKERVSTVETNANLSEVFGFRQDRINARMVAARQMKRLFGWNVKVSYYSDEMIGGEYGGELYGGSEDNLRKLSSGGET